MAKGDDLIRMTARQVVALLERRQVSPLELIDAAMARIEAVDGAVNALPIRSIERAREQARRLPRPPEDRRGWLGGLPLAIKDSMDVAGMRSTHGSPIYADHVPAASDLQVEALEGRGGIVLARSNAPEFAAGSNTFNEVFGSTLNPWNTAMTCGGSSGGSAVAVATGEVWLANGSDLGGSLRIPASFCSVVGLRTSPGLVPQGPAKHLYDGLAVSGPMARNIGDLGLMLDAMAVFDARDPLSVEPPARPFLEGVDEAGKHPPRRVGFSRDLGFLPVDAEVAGIAEAAAWRFAERGAAVEAAGPDFSGASEIFQTLRAVRFAANYAPLLPEHRARIKPDVIWNIEKGLKLDGEAVGRAMRERAALYSRVVRFFAEYDLLATPAVIVPPFPVGQRYVEEVAGRRFDNYVDWLGMSYAVTLVGCPALSLPCGFTRSGLPVGIQLVGRPRGERHLLAVAALLEEQLGLARLLPIEPRPAPG